MYFNYAAPSPEARRLRLRSGLRQGCIQSFTAGSQRGGLALGERHHLVKAAVEHISGMVC